MYIQVVVVEAQHAFHHDSCFNAAVVIEVVVLTDVHTFKTCPWQSVVPPAQQAMCPSQIDERSNKDRFSGSRFQYTSILSLKKKYMELGAVQNQLQLIFEPHQELYMGMKQINIKMYYASGDKGK